MLRNLRSSYISDLARYAYPADLCQKRRTITWIKFSFCGTEIFGPIESDTALGYSVIHWGCRNLVGRRKGFHLSITNKEVRKFLIGPRQNEPSHTVIWSASKHFLKVNYYTIADYQL